MKLEIDEICEGKIRHYKEVFDEAMSQPKSKDIDKKLNDAAILVANSMVAKLWVDDSFNRMVNK